MSTYNNGPGNIPQLPDRVVDTLIDSAGVSTYHPDGSQLGTLHALVHGVAEELLARLPTAPVQEAAAAAAPLTDITRITELMLDVHHKGRAVVSSGTREKAELDVMRLHEHGLWATMQQEDAT